MKFIKNIFYVSRLFASVKNRIGFIALFFNRFNGLIIFKDGVNLQVNSFVGLKFLNSIFLNKVYGEINNDSGNFVIDIGGNQGYFTIYALSKRKNLNVLCFEPFEPSYQSILNNLQMNNFQDRVKVFNFAVGGHTRYCALDIGENDVDHKLLEGGMILCKGINEVFEENNIDKVDVLKLNCEGFEYEILENISKDNLLKIDSIRLEYHNMMTINGSKEYNCLVDGLKDYDLTHHKPMNKKHGIMHFSRRMK